MEVRASEKGFVLIATCIALTVLLALAGFAIDIGRMYIIRSELQAYADSAALSAACELNGAASGIEKARAAAERLATGEHAMRWDMGTQPITSIVTSFSTDNRIWQEHPRETGNLRFARIVASEPAPVIFLRIFQPRSSLTVAVSGVATKTGHGGRLVQ